LDLKRIRYFMAVADQLHFGRAAERMNVVQPAISQQIKRLEEELGVTLFLRSGNEVRLTEAGRQMLPECSRLLDQADEVARVARAAAAGTRGKIRFGYVDNSIFSLLPPLIREFRHRFPDVDMVLETMIRAQQSETLLDHRLDIALMPGPAPQGDFDSEMFVSEQLVVALPARHPLADVGSLSLGALASEPFVLFPTTMRSRLLEIILAACATASFTPRVVQEAAQIHTLVALVDAGLGITLLPPWAATGNGGQVVFRELVNPAPTYDLMMVWGRNERNALISGLLDVARDIAPDLLPNRVSAA
jgi:DNA-binding transcriptional LysR family regulator